MRCASTVLLSLPCRPLELSGSLWCPAGAMFLILALAGDSTVRFLNSPQSVLDTIGPTNGRRENGDIDLEPAHTFTRRVQRPARGSFPFCPPAALARFHAHPLADMRSRYALIRGHLSGSTHICLSTYPAFRFASRCMRFSFAASLMALNYSRHVRKSSLPLFP